MAAIRDRRVGMILFALVVALFAALALSGCSGLEPTVKPEGMFGCIDCHTDRAMLKADLEADPLPEKVEAASEGEG